MPHQENISYFGDGFTGDQQPFRTDIRVTGRDLLSQELYTPDEQGLTMSIPAYGVRWVRI